MPGWCGTPEKDDEAERFAQEVRASGEPWPPPAWRRPPPPQRPSWLRRLLRWFAGRRDGPPERSA